MTPNTFTTTQLIKKFKLFKILLLTTATCLFSLGTAHAEVCPQVINPGFMGYAWERASLPENLGPLEGNEVTCRYTPSRLGGAFEISSNFFKTGLDITPTKPGNWNPIGNALVCTSGNDCEFTANDAKGNEVDAFPTKTLDIEWYTNKMNDYGDPLIALMRQSCWNAQWMEACMLPKLIKAFPNPK